MRFSSLFLGCLLGVALSSLHADDLRIGIIGLDTSHVIAFSKILNDPAAPNHVPGAKVVVAYKAFSADIPDSAARVEVYTPQIQKDCGVKLVGSIEDLCQQVDCVMIESVDGRPHLDEARQVFAAKKRVFIDKPIGGTLRDGLEIVRLAKEAGVPIFSSSAYRYYDSMVELKKANVGEIRSAISYGPAHLEPHHPDLFWYGIHPTEALYTVMGRGCESVTRAHTEDTDVVVGTWSGGRTGTLVALRTKPLPHKVTVFGTVASAEQKAGPDDYAPLIREVVQFFQTGVSPVPAEDTIEILAFMEAADESKRRGGVPVKISEVMETAQKPLPASGEPIP